MNVKFWIKNFKYYTSEEFCFFFLLANSISYLLNYFLLIFIAFNNNYFVRLNVKLCKVKKIIVHLIISHSFKNPKQMKAVKCTSIIKLIGCISLCCFIQFIV